MAFCNAKKQKTCNLFAQVLKGNESLRFAVLTGCLSGLLRHREDWLLYSNAESEDGFSDIMIEDMEAGIGIVIELKYREDGKLEEGCQEALKQIESLGYVARIEDDGISMIIIYGIVRYKKRCRV